jgi:hypothetical protein
MTNVPPDLFGGITESNSKLFTGESPDEDVNNQAECVLKTFRAYAVRQKSVFRVGRTGAGLNIQFA